MKLKLLLSVLVLLVSTAAQSAAKDVVIVTSFPKELFETYKKAFEAKNPGINVVINSKQTFLPAAPTFHKACRQCRAVTKRSSRVTASSDGKSFSKCRG